MRIWDLPVSKRIHFPIAADSRFCSIDPFNDQVWDFTIGSADPPALTLQTTYGLRAQSMRIFPSFTVDDRSYTNPFDFHDPPKIIHFLPNYFSLRFSPFEGLDVTSEYWVPDTNTITGRYQLQNQGNKVITTRFNLMMNLKPLSEGENMSPDVLGTNPVLVGKTHDLIIVGALLGNAYTNQSPYPVLSQDLQVVPGKSKTVQWIVTSKTHIDQSSAHIKDIFAKNWEAEIARLLMHNDSQTIEIHTGDPEWDLAFAAAQRAASLLVMGNKEDHPPFLTNRSPDRGYSFAKNGKEITRPWKVVSALDAYYLLGFLLPGGLTQVRGILDSFLSKYKDPDSKLNQVDQPLLCSMALMYYRASKDRAWLKENINHLKYFLSLWFKEDIDRDQDSFPEWQDIYQSGLEENPTFSRWKPETQGLNIRLVESPSLSSFLYMEGACLLELSKAAEESSDTGWIVEKMDQLRRQTEKCWNEKHACYLYRDYQTHISQKGRLLNRKTGNTKLILNKSFSRPQRLLLHIIGEEDTRRRFKITLYGRNQKQEITEEIDYLEVSWLHGRAYFTTNETYTRLQDIEIQGMNEQDLVEIFCADHQMLDISLLLPIWAQMAENNHAGKLIEKTIRKAFWGKYGLPIAPQSHNDLFLAKPPKILGVWNHLVGKGLLAQHRYDLAASLVINWMTAIVKNFQKLFSFQESYHAQTAEPSGEIGHLRGFPPLNLFLEILGVKYIYKDHVVVTGSNPFPWPVTVKYKGTNITWHQSDTVITFSSGHTITVSGSEPQEVRLVREDISE